MQLERVKSSKQNCFSCKHLTDDDYCKHRNNEIRSPLKGKCSDFESSGKEVNKKVKCEECHYFKFGYYCDIRKKTAPYSNRRKLCKTFK